MHSPTMNVGYNLQQTSKLQMGANPSHSYQQARFSIDEWQAVPLAPYTDIKDPSYGSNFTIYANKLNPNVELQKYDLFFNNYNEFQVYKATVQWRNNIRCVVPIKYIRQPEKQQFCGSFYLVEVFLERTPIRLVEIQDISIQEGICILYSSFQGFQKFYDKHGYFQIIPQMIGFNKEGFVRTWLNPNLSKHHPENHHIQTKNKTFQHFMQQVLEMIEKEIDFQSKQTVTDFIQKCRVSHPYAKMNVVLELYAAEVGIIVPRYLNSIRNVCSNYRKRSYALEKQRNRVKLQSKSSFRSIEGRKLVIQGRPMKVADWEKPNLTHREPLEPLQFKKVSSGENDRYLSQTSRTPTVRFHYRNSMTLPSSPKGHYQPGLHFARKSVSTLTAHPEHINSSQSHSFFRKNKVVFSKSERFEIDPEIAADLAKLTE